MPYVHDIDPVLGELGGVYFWWYGLSYALGFLNIYWFLWRNRTRIGLSDAEAPALSLFFCSGVLFGGRLVEVLFDEWPFYRDHPGLVPAVWLGGMATHGLLGGAAAGTWLFAHLYGKSFRVLADALVVPGAFLMGIGRLGNFIDGQIVGEVTSGWWGVKFPDAEGFRHPVVLYDGLKNLLLVPFLMRARQKYSTPGATAARFVFWYAFLRIFIDLARDYPTHRLQLGTGQTLNIVMALLGILLLVRSRLRRLGHVTERQAKPRPARPHPRVPAVVHHVAFGALLIVSLTIPSNWTQDVPARYGKRHSGLGYSIFYPHIDTAPPARRETSHVMPGGTQAALFPKFRAAPRRSARRGRGRTEISPSKT